MLRVPALAERAPALGARVTESIRINIQELDDPALQRLSPDLFKTWFNVLCAAGRCGGKLPPAGDLAFKLRLEESESCRRLAQLDKLGLLAPYLSNGQDPRRRLRPGHARSGR